MSVTNCAVGGLATYVPSAQDPWNKQKAIHLYRRISLGANLNTLEDALSRSPIDIVDEIINYSSTLPIAPEPEWAYWQLSDYDSDDGIRNQQLINQLLSWGTNWFYDIKNNLLRDRMSFFWHNHFVTRQEDYGCPSWMYQYHMLLQQYALGNFKEFVREMGKTPAMLVYLNNVQNTRFDVNENYARELLELFTLGVDNGYTQNDIVEVARAITGWNDIDVNDLCGTIEFSNLFWDPSDKTIFGRTGSWNYDDVIDILFEERTTEISEFICGKLYTHFVNPKVHEGFVSELAQVMRDADFELKPVLKTLFSSQHFFDEANIGTVIPGHIEYFMTFLNEIGYRDIEDLIYAVGYSAGDFGQAVFNPVDVAGWKGNRDWINSSNLNYRWEGIFNIMVYYYDQNNQSLPELMDFLTGLVGQDERDPDLIAKAVIDHFLPKGLQTEMEYKEAYALFRGEVPENYYDLGIWDLSFPSVPLQIFQLLNHIANLPEFQLR